MSSAALAKASCRLTSVYAPLSTNSRSSAYPLTDLSIHHTSLLVQPVGNARNTALETGEVHSESNMDTEDLDRRELERTLALIKPDAVQAGKADEIMQLIELAGFTIIAQQKLQVGTCTTTHLKCLCIETEQC